MSDEQDLGTLPRLWVASITMGLLTMAICLWGTGLPSRVDWLFILLSVALGGAVFGGVFFIGANLAGVKFESRVSDETKIRGSNVEHITHINAYDDAKLDMWLDRYVFARNLFGGLIIPLLIFAGLFFFAV